MISPTFRRLRPRRRLGWLWVGVTIATLLNGLRLRARVAALSKVPTRDRADRAAGDGVAADLGGSADVATSTNPGASPDLGASPEADPDHVFVTARGVQLDDRTRREASAYARRRHLDVLDLVPADLATEQLLDLVRLVDPSTYPSNRLAPGRGPGQATLVHRGVLARAGIDEIDGLDPVAYLEVTARLKQYAAKTTDLAVLDGVLAVDEDASTRGAYLSALYSKAAPAVVAVPAVHYLLLGAGLIVAPGWGLAALASYCAQPYLAFAGTDVRPGDLTPAAALARPLRGMARAARTVRGGWVAPDRSPTAAATGSSSATASSAAEPGSGESTPESEYAVLLTDGIDRFFEPRRDTCPLCGGTDLTERVRMPDLLQFKPGEFVVDGCRECGHVFQNPRLSLDGLDFYYRDFYDGLGGEQLDFVFSSDDTSYRGRVDLVAAHARPKRWLDVGAGHGHFCLIASDVLPETRFEGLDLSDGIVEAERREWIERAHMGLFPDLAEGLRGAFDVVSMHHYLEHTRDPAAELDAAATALEAGGHLLIEVPDPECRYGRTLGWMWGPWFQPQHQHFVSVDNLTSLLRERGFTVVAVERGPAHQPVDLAFGLMLATNRIAGAPAKPWRTTPSPLARLWRSLCFCAMAPLMVLALVLDRLIAPVVARRPGGSNTYRLLARKD